MESITESFVLVSNIPTDRRPSDLKKWISKLSSNCGGKKISLNVGKGEASIRFGCISDARRAQQRIDRQDVFGNTIRASLEPIESNTDSSDTSEEPNPTEAMAPKLPRIYRSRNRMITPTPDIQLNELLPYCNIHSRGQSGVTNSTIRSFLPSVNISIPVLAKRVHRLLDTHGGGLPVKSFLDCYVKEFHELVDTTTKPLVALEHLITCVPGVCISNSVTNPVKRITWIPNRDRFLSEDGSNSELAINPRTGDHYPNTQLQHFGKEIRELLKSQPHATVAFNKFVPTYHNHFVRQLCVGHYGCLKLSELLEEIPHIAQVYGENDSRMITLTHREQTKRFANDLIKVLKAQNGRRVKLSEFPNAYQLIFEKPFDICDYGVCYMDDILRDVWEGTVVMTPFGSNDKWIELPKRERTADHKRRTALFAQEVIELLNKSKEVIDFQLTFSKFIPCYHRYYNKQCRVSEYGFTKLIELLEELSPKVVEIGTEEKFGEKHLRLNHENRVKALISRFESILKQSESRSASVTNFELEYNRKYKSKIDYIEYYANDLIDLIDKMPNNKFRIIQTKNDLRISLLDSNHFRVSAKRITRLLMEEPNGEMSISELELRYLKEFGQNLDSHVLSGTFSDAFTDDSNIVRLTELFRFCRDCIQCMQSSHKRKFTVDELDRELMRRFERPLPQPTYYKCRSICELFTKFFDFFRIEKRKTNAKPICLISLDQHFVKKPLALRQPVYQILKRPETQSEVEDLMDSDCPESLPLPDLVPSNTSISDMDLIHWSSQSSDSSEVKSCYTPDLMFFNDECEVASGAVTEVNNDENCWADSSTTTGAVTVDESHSKPSMFRISNSFRQKKSRIIANLS